MDDIFLEMIKDTAHQYVRTCTKHCPSRKVCEYRHKRRKTRADQSCTREHSRFTKFALHVSGIDRGEEVYFTSDAILTDLIHAAIDAALMDMEIARCTRRQAAYETSSGQKAKSHSAEMREDAALRAEIRLSMTLSERKQKLIDTCTTIRSRTKLAYSSEKVFRARRKEKLAEEMPEIIREEEELENMTTEEIRAYNRDGWEGVERLRSGDFSEDAPKENENNEQAAKNAEGVNGCSAHAAAEADKACFLPEACQKTHKQTETSDEENPRAPP